MKKIIGMMAVIGLMFGINGVVMAGRPLSTDDANTVLPGHLEVETGIDYAKQPDDKEYSLALVLTTGVIWDRVDVGIEIPYSWLWTDTGKYADGFGDVTGTLKVRFLDETETNPALAFTVGVKTATGDENKGLGTGKIDIPLNFIATKGFHRVSVHANLGYNFIYWIAREGEATSDRVGYGIAVECVVTDIFCVVGEVVGEIQTRDTNEDNSAEILVGSTYLLPVGSVLDGGIRFRLSGDIPDYRFTVGLTHEF